MVNSLGPKSAQGQIRPCTNKLHNFVKRPQERGNLARELTLVFNKISKLELKEGEYKRSLRRILIRVIISKKPVFQVVLRVTEIIILLFASFMRDRNQLSPGRAYHPWGMIQAGQHLQLQQEMWIL